MSTDSYTDTMRELFENYVAENDKFLRGNGSAGTRARKSLMELKKACDSRRKEIQEVKNATKTSK